MRSKFKARLLVSVFVMVVGHGLSSSALAMTVFDPKNFAQNLLQAARALEQIQNQAKSLQNEAQMLTNTALNLKQLDATSLGEITSALRLTCFGRSWHARITAARGPGRVHR